MESRSARLQKYTREDRRNNSNITTMAGGAYADEFNDFNPDGIFRTGLVTAD
jgi:hypothetical protein